MQHPYITPAPGSVQVKRYTEMNYSGCIYDGNSSPNFASIHVLDLDGFANLRHTLHDFEKAKGRMLGTTGLKIIPLMISFLVIHVSCSFCSCSVSFLALDQTPTTMNSLVEQDTLPGIPYLINSYMRHLRPRHFSIA